MKALLSGVLCAGLCGQAPVLAAEPEPTVIGHASLGWQQDDADGEALSFALALPVAAHWALTASQSETDNDITTIDGDSRATSTSRRFGVQIEGSAWGASISQLSFDDGAVLETDETNLLLRYRGDRLDIGFELGFRGHEVTIELLEQTRQESFDSRGVGLHLGWRTASELRLFGGWQQYRYDDARVLDSGFGSRLLDYTRLYNTLMGQRDQADGALVDHNGWVGIDVPLADHLLTVEHSFSELEIDGDGFSTDTVILALTLGAHWGLDLSAGISRGDEVEDIVFAGLAVHAFW